MADINELDPKRFGVIVRRGRTGLLLPDLEGVSTVEEQLAIEDEAGIFPDEPLEIYRFEVKRYY